MPDFASLWKVNERRIGELLHAVRSQLKQPEIDEVQCLLSAREYGLALEALASFIDQENATVTPAMVRQVDEIAESMDLGQESFIQKLHWRGGVPPSSSL
jgi:hypothetical protein